MPDQSAPTPAASKPWWLSKTLWFNAVCAAFGAAEAGMGLWQPLLPVNSYAVLAFVLAVGNAALRVVTNQALAADPVSEGGR